MLQTDSERDEKTSESGAEAPHSPEAGAAVGPARADADKRPVLVIVHQKHSQPGRIGHWLRGQGYRLDIRRPRFGDPLPETMDAHAGAVIFGGPMSANDTDDFMRTETDWIGVPLSEQRPFLGVCLGAQMLARHLGARVGPHPAGCVEVGYYPVRPTAQGRAICDWPEAFYQWHTEGFELASGATCLASGTIYDNQAFAYGPAAAGVQFHPEITYALVNRWTTHRPDRLAQDGARPRHEHFHGHLAHFEGISTWLDTFLTRWLQAGLEVTSPDTAPGESAHAPRASEVG